MEIRPAVKSDVQKLQDLNDEVFVDNSKYDPDLKRNWAQSGLGKKYFAEVVSDPEAICLIAEENNKPIGYIAAGPKEFNYRLSKYLEIQNMGVSPDFRSKGVGSQLMNKCLAIAKSRGYQKVYVTSYFENSKAVSFYENNGFKRIDLSLEKNLE